MNPLFPSDSNQDKDEQRRPASHADNPAVEMIRRKIEAAYSNEPNARQEMDKVEHMAAVRSKHQEFMHQLTASGKSMAEIQAAWHEYYQNLSDHEKHAVWQEFYR